MADVAGEFETFHDNISLGEPQVGRMNSAAAAVTDFLRSSYGLSTSDVYLQGSYANHTAIEPVHGGEYDVDIICVCVPDDWSADKALDDLEARFVADGRYANRVKRKKPCVRLEYAEDNVGKFHVDVVPVRRTGQMLPPLEAPRRGDGWHGTCPAEYTQWCTDQGALYARTVKMMKRWRDEQQSVRVAIKSIVLQVLVAEHMPPGITDDAQRIAMTLNSMHAAVASLPDVPVVLNPVLPTENLAARWTRESFVSFRKELDEAVELSGKAVASADNVEACDLWNELFGDDFPKVTPTALGLEIGDYSHASAPAARGWSLALDDRYKVEIRAWTQLGKRGQSRREYRSQGRPIFAGRKIQFKASVTAPNHVEVWWQVANTGGHARKQNGLRGPFFKGKTLSNVPTADQAENWESTSYTGSHLVRAVLVRSNVVVAQSGWFVVNIYSKGNPFSL